MSRADAKETWWEKVEVHGREGLVTNAIVSRDTAPEGW